MDEEQALGDFGEEVDGQPNEKIVVKVREKRVEIQNSQIKPEEHVEKAENEFRFVLSQ